MKTNSYSAIWSRIMIQKFKYIPELKSNNLKYTRYISTILYKRDRFVYTVKCKKKSNNIWMNSI